jgi:hypothetical protein
MRKKILTAASVLTLTTLAPFTSVAQWEVDFGKGEGGCPANKSYVMYWDENGNYQGSQCLLGEPA